MTRPAEAAAAQPDAVAAPTEPAHEPLSDTARRVLAARYLRRDGAGNVSESPDELFARVARAVAHAELLLGNAAAAAEWERRFCSALAARDFLPNSPALMNAGTPLGQLAACFVLPMEDTMEDIFGSLRAMALVQRTGGGTGFSFSRLRPRGARLHSTGGEASGPLSFMRVFDAATEHIRLGGRRRGANMAVPRRARVRRCEARRLQPEQLQSFRRRHRCLHAGGRARRPVHAAPRRRCGAGGGGARAVRPHRRRRVDDR
jgi:ribonucleoside-diphosphate reductase alpha chain